ncbi:Efflux pump radE [Lachnellula arida]|uniref:Efflux pump radE n=1 Tax=Lachnellula arida TaxID=1316785 RepID=A0A8T9B7D4_9HELO|nr:Efflux pump radE [Lachnellula arida]
MASSSAGFTHVPNPVAQYAQSAGKHKRSVSDTEKEMLAAYKGHDADIPSNEGYVLDAVGELKREQAIATQYTTYHSTRKSGETPPKDGASEEVEKQSADASVGESDNSNIVWWDGPDDPQNPLNFSSWLKALNIGLVASICFVSPLASSMFAPGVPEVMKEFKNSNVELASFVVSVYVLGFAAGPMVLAPLSEIYGRLPVYHACNVGFVAFTAACALSTNLKMLIGFRFVAGCFGSAPLTNGGGSIADLVIQENRGRGMSFFVLGPIIGPVRRLEFRSKLISVVGPVAGGYLSEAKGWRWVFWVLAMLSGFCTILCFFFMRETYAPTILSRKAARLRKETGNLELRSKLDIGLSTKDFFIRSIIRPAKMLALSPIVLSTSLYVGVIYGYLYLLFTTFTLVFEDSYGFSSGSVGLTFMGIGVGSIGGLIFFAFASDKILRRQTEKADAVAAAAGKQSAGMKPEYRLPMMLPGSVLIPMGFLLYGWTANYHVHWIVPIISTSLIGIGNLAVFMTVTTYLVDAFTIYAASALAANSVVRSVIGAVLPLAGQKMYLALGLGWGNSLLAFVAMALLPVPIVLMKWGERLRKKFELKNL